MIPDKLKKYVLDNIEMGWEKEDIEKVLFEAEWPRDEIRKVFEDDEVKAHFSKQGKVISGSGEKNEKEKVADNGQEKDAPDSLNSDTSSPNTFAISYKDETPDSFEIEGPPVPEDSSSLDGLVMNVDLGSYVKNSLSKGFSKSVIKKVARQAGWSDAEIDGVLSEESDS